MLAEIQQVLLANNAALEKNFEKTLQKNLLMQSHVFDLKLNELDNKIKAKQISHDQTIGSRNGSGEFGEV